MNLKAFVAEFIGTFALIFVGVAAIAHGNATLVGIALAHGLTIAVMVSATAAVSGGHLNPAVTVGALLARKIKPADAIGYIVAQCAGGLVASLLLMLSLPAGAAALVQGTPALEGSVSIGGGMAIEAVLTFFLVFVVFGTAIDPRAPKVGGLFIGLTVALGILAGGPFTGAALNPARHLGPALLSGDAALVRQVWLYWVGPLLGGALAAVVYQNALAERPAATA